MSQCLLHTRKTSARKVRSCIKFGFVSELQKKVPDSQIGAKTHAVCMSPYQAFMHFPYVRLVVRAPLDHLSSLRRSPDKNRVREGPEAGGILSTIAFFMETLLLGPGYSRLPSGVTVMLTLNPQWITDRISYSWGMREDRTEGHTLYQLRNLTKACNYFHNNKQVEAVLFKAQVSARTGRL